MRAPGSSNAFGQLTPTDIKSAELIGFRRYYTSVSAALLPVFATTEGDFADVLLYQMYDLQGLVVGFIADSSVNADQLVYVGESFGTETSTSVGDERLMAYEARDGKCVVSRGSHFRVLITALLRNEPTLPPFAKLEIARFIGDKDLELKFTTECARSIARQSASVARAWCATLEPQSRASVHAQLDREIVQTYYGTRTPTSYRTGLVAALDIGSSKVACLIGRAEPGSLKVLGAALRESEGVKSAAVTSLDHVEEAVRETVAAAESHANTRIKNVLISVGCGGPTSITARAAMALDGALVSDEHLHALLSEGRVRCRLENHEVIQAAPTSYVVDEVRGVRDPRGMFCQRIGVSMHAVAVKPSPLQNLKIAVERCHLTVAGSLFSGYASGLSTLTPDELQLGATVIDMGGGVTSIAVFMEGQLVYADSVPMGGTHVTSDLARMLAAPLSAAERIKTLYGVALDDIETGTDTVAVPQMGEDGDENVVRVPRSMLTRIVQPRLEEIFSQVQAKLHASGYDGAAGRRTVLTGGACQLAGTRELAQRVLNKQVRLGRPQTFQGLPAAAAGPHYATALGLLMAGATMPPEALNPDLNDRPYRSVFSRLWQSIVR